ncbi:MAG: hypothetical protein M3R06_01015 [Chloroflexota bacterium]|nr:hypothetical protein [Chloroflexota bacterium]
MRLAAVPAPRRVVSVPLTGSLSTVGIAAIGILGVTGQSDNARLAAGSNLDWITVAATVALGYTAILTLHLLVRLWVYHLLRVEVRRVRFYLFGAVPELVDDSATPRTETLVGLAGLASLACMAVVAAALFALTRQAADTLRLGSQILAVGATSLLAIQAMPAAALDGGRVFRALVWYLTDSPLTGLRAAVLYGRIVAAGLICGGLALMTLDDALPYWGLLAIGTGWRIATASHGAVRQVDWQRATRQRTLAELSVFSTRRILASLTIDEALERLIDPGDDRSCLVVDENNAVIGVISLEQVRGIPRRAWSEVRLETIMVSIDALPRLDAASSVFDAIEVVESADALALRVETEGALVTVIGRDRLTSARR